MRSAEAGGRGQRPEVLCTQKPGSLVMERREAEVLDLTAFVYVNAFRVPGAGR